MTDLVQSCPRLMFLSLYGNRRINHEVTAHLESIRPGLKLLSVNAR